jgi:hypothetical protein
MEIIMSLGEKKPHTGIVRLQHVGGHSKSGRVTHVLDTGEGPPMILRLKGGNAMRDPAFDAYVGKRVKIDGVAGSGVPFIMVENLADITVLGPPARTSRPKGPRP